MAKLWIGNKLYSVENEVQDYCDKQDERIELLKSRVEQLEYTEICEDCSAKTELPQKLIGCNSSERIKKLEAQIDKDAFAYNHAIHMTPTSDMRNKLTEMNIERLQALKG